MNRRIRRSTAWGITAAAWLLVSGPVPTAHAQDAAPAAPAAPEALTKDDLMKRLETRKAQLALDQAKVKMERAKVDLEETQGLFADKVVTIDKLNQAHQTHEEAVLAYEQAKIDLEKTRLDFLKEAIRVAVTDAKKYRGAEGQVMVSIRLRNDSDLDKVGAAMADDADVSPEARRSLLTIDTLVVSIRDNGATIGDPYELVVPQLSYGQETNLEYRLLKRDAEQLSVAVEVLGTQKEYNVFLKKEATEDLPAISSTQYAQQGQLGTKIRYDLELERLAKTEQSFALVVMNLPPEFPFAFLDPSSGAQITQVKFTSELSKQSLSFEVSIPAKLATSLIDKNLSFHILVTRQSEMKAVFDLTRKYEGQEVPLEEIARLKANKVNLILIPKGTPKVELVVPNLFKEIQIGETAELKFSVFNPGTLAVRSLVPSLDPPVDWQVEIEPREIAALEPGIKQPVTVTIRPAADVAVGEYSMVLKCAGHSGIDTVEAVEKDFKLRISPKSHVTGTLVLVLVLVGLVLFIAVASVRISRR